MAFALITSRSYLITDDVAALHDFAAAENVNCIRMTNITGSPATVELWFDYDGTLANDVDKVLDHELAADESVVLDGTFTFANGGRISGKCSVDNAVNFHMSGATI